MQVLFENIKSDLKQYNIISLLILKIGTVIMIILSLAAVITKLLLICYGSDIPLLFFYEDLLECIKESFVSIYFSALLLEALHIISKNTAV